MLIVNHKLLVEFRQAGPCEWCGRVCQRREPHHLRSRGAGQLDIRCNLLSVGSSLAFECTCHTLIHNGEVGRCDLLAVVAAREKVLQGDITRFVDVLRRLIKPTTAELRRALSGLPMSTQALARRELEECGILEAA